MWRPNKFTFPDLEIRNCEWEEYDSWNPNQGLGLSAIPAMWFGLVSLTRATGPNPIKKTELILTTS